MNIDILTLQELAVPFIFDAERIIEGLYKFTVSNRPRLAQSVSDSALVLGGTIDSYSTPFQFRVYVKTEAING
jgi:hypothetical protein